MKDDVAFKLMAVSQVLPLSFFPLLFIHEQLSGSQLKAETHGHIAFNVSSVSLWYKKKYILIAR